MKHIILYTDGACSGNPGLCLLVGDLLAVDRPRLLDTAAAIETIHTFTLVHDDVMDGDRKRRGEPALWVREGEATAINVGNMQFAHAVAMVPSPLETEAAETVLTVTEGQQQDLDFEQRRDVTVEEYMTMAERKTGALIEFALEAPQLLAGVDLELSAFARLGPAFQIRDDLLDFEPGKGRAAVGNDVRSGKRTLLVAHADSSRLYDILDRPFEATTDDDVAEAIEILERQGSFAFAREWMTDLADEALAATADLPETEETARLRELGEFLVERDV